MSDSILDARPQPRWQRRKHARPAEILEAALHEFVETGYAATRLEDIARRAGVTKGTMYLYFENKEALFQAVVRQHLMPDSEAIAVRMGDPTTPARQLLEELLRARWQQVFGGHAGGLVKLLIAESQTFPDLARHYHDELVSGSCRLVVDILKRGMARGEFRDDLDLAEVARLALTPVVMGAVWKHSFQRVVPQSSVDPERYFDNALRMLLNAISATPTPAAA